MVITDGVEIRPFSDALLAAARDASRDLLEDMAAAEPSFRQVYEAWRANRDASRRYFATSELAYTRFAFA
ncbi:MAG: hypothetical protein AAF772_21120 [Acidobacteriota bacterium]